MSMVRTASPTPDRDERHVHDRGTHVVGPKIERGARGATKAKTNGEGTIPGPQSRFGDELVSVAEQLIVKGKEQGYLTLHDALKALNVLEEVDGRQRSLEEMLTDIIERLATVKRIGQRAYIAQELLGLADISK